MPQNLTDALRKLQPRRGGLFAARVTRFLQMILYGQSRTRVIDDIADTKHR